MAQPRAHKIVRALATAAGQVLTTAQLAEATGIPRKQISDTCDRLRRRGYVDRVATGRFRVTRSGQEFAKAGGIIKPGPCGPFSGRRKALPSLRSRAWRAMAVLDKFTISDLLELAAKGNEGNPRNNLQIYLRALERGGYVARLHKRQPGTRLTSPGHVRFVRLKHTGPKAPVLDRTAKTLFDPNTETTIDIGGTAK